MNKKENQVLKAQNAFKNIITFYIFLTNITAAFSQKEINGKFINSRGNGFATEYIFDSNGVFKKTNYQDYSTTYYGKGHYHIKNDSLVLNYDLTELKTQSYHKYNYYNSFNDSITVKITVLDMGEKPIYNIHVDNSYDLSDKNAFQRSKKDGIVTFKFKKERKKIDIMMSDQNYWGHFFPIWIDRSYNIKVYLKKDPYNATPIKGGVLKYKIVSITKDTIKLKADNGAPIVWKRKKE